MATIAERIKKALEIRQLKQADLVEKTKIGKSSISTYISGAYEPKQKNIYLIAKALDVSEAWLMGLDVPMERRSAPSTEQAFMEYLYSLGYRIYRDDPEHKPFMGSENISACRLDYNTLELLKLRVDSYVKATVDSELLALKEEEIKRKRIEKERILKLLRTENTHKDVRHSQENKSYLEPLAAHHRADIDAKDITEEMKQNDMDIMNDPNF